MKDNYIFVPYDVKIEQMLFHIHWFNRINACFMRDKNKTVIKVKKSLLGYLN